MVKTIRVRCIYSIVGRDITKYTVMYGIYIRFWLALLIFRKCSRGLRKYHGGMQHTHTHTHTHTGGMQHTHTHTGGMQHTHSTGGIQHTHKAVAGLSTKPCKGSIALVFE